MPTKSGQEYESKYARDPIIIIKARALMVMIFRFTSKKAKLPTEEFKEDTNNGMPAKYQHSIGTRLQNYSLELLEELKHARYFKKDRQESLMAALCTLNNIEECLYLCFTLGVIRSASAAEAERLRIEIKNMALAWLDKVTQG